MWSQKVKATIKTYDTCDHKKPGVEQKENKRWNSSETDFKGFLEGS